MKSTTYSDPMEHVQRLCDVANAATRGLNVDRPRAEAVSQEKLAPAIIRDLEDEDLGDETRAFWSSYAKGERTDMLRVFIALARDGALSKSDAEEVRYFLKDVTTEQRVDAGGTVTLVPKFKSNLGRFAYVINELAARRLPIRVGACQRCGDLFWQSTKGRGRPRVCCEARGCAQLAASAAWKERNPDWRTRKPKSKVRRKK